MACLLTPPRDRCGCRPDAPASPMTRPQHSPRLSDAHPSAASGSNILSSRSSQDTSSRLSLALQHAPKPQIPIALPGPRGFVLRGLSYASPSSETLHQNGTAASGLRLGIAAIPFML